MEIGISERRVARDLLNSMRKNKIEQFENLKEEVISSKYGLVVNPELGLYFVPGGPRGRTLSLNKLPGDLITALVEKEKANPEVGLYFIPESPRGRTGLSLNKLPKDLITALVEKEKADADVVNLPCWVSEDHVVVKDRKHYVVFSFSISGSTTVASKVEATVTNKDKLEKRLGRKLTGVTKYVMPRRTVSALYEKYSKETTE